MGHILLSFLFYNILVIVFYSHYRRGHYYINKTNVLLYTILLIVFGTYGGGEGDYLHYKETVENVHSVWDVLQTGGLEPQYTYLAYLLDGNYLLWRLVIWSIQFLGLGWFLYKAKLNTYPVMLVFTSLFLVTSCYGRVYWGVIYYFMGLYLLIERKNPLFLMAIALCYISHTSNLVLIALLPLGFINLKRWHLVVIIICFGTIITSFNDFFTSLSQNGGIEGADHFNSRLRAYSGGENEISYWGNSIGEKTIFVLRHAPLFILLFSIVKLFIYSYNKYKQIYTPVRRIMSIYLALNVVSFIFLFADMGSGAYFYRVLAMSFFPISLFLPYLTLSKLISRKTFNSK